jgi:hypothetical protein
MIHPDDLVVFEKPLPRSPREPRIVSRVQQTYLVGPADRIQTRARERAHALQQSIAQPAGRTLDDDQGLLYQALQAIQRRPGLRLTTSNGKRGVQRPRADENTKAIEQVALAPFE